MDPWETEASSMRIFETQVRSGFGAKFVNADAVHCGLHVYGGRSEVVAPLGCFHPLKHQLRTAEFLQFRSDNGTVLAIFSFLHSTIFVASQTSRHIALRLGNLALSGLKAAYTGIGTSYTENILAGDETMGE